MQEVEVTSMAAASPGMEIMVPISSLDPDLNKDGHVEEWEQKTYDAIKAMDTTGSGQVSVKVMMAAMHKAVKDANADGIPISSLDPDSDGDGKIEPWEMDVFKRIQAADADQSGSISVKELFGVIKGAAESDKQKKLFQRLLFVAMFIIVLLVAAMFVVSVAAGESIKESRVSPDAAEMKAPDGSVVSTGQAEVETTIWETALLTPYELGNLKFLSFYVDLTAVTAYAAWAEFTLKPTGAFKTFLNDATFSTAEGHEVYIDSETSTGTIRFGSGSMAGTTYPIAEAVPDTVRRQLDEKPMRNPTLTTVTTERRDELKLPREEAPAASAAAAASSLLAAASP